MSSFYGKVGKSQPIKKSKGTEVSWRKFLTYWLIWMAISAVLIILALMFFT